MRIFSRSSVCRRCNASRQEGKRRHICPRRSARADVAATFGGAVGEELKPLFDPVLYRTRLPQLFTRTGFLSYLIISPNLARMLSAVPFVSDLGKRRSHSAQNSGLSRLLQNQAR